ncbi:MAG TPA: sel1 repeat family protein [Gammaproteobacteria bacterium]|nr:sel1 repeat family protein [Gammaproteobacteria bacterium]
MALKIQLTSTGPGYATLSIQKLQVNGELELSFQRSSDHHYLASGEQWTATAHWHRVSDVQASGDGCSCTLGPDIIDGLLLSSNDALMVALRGGTSGQGVLRIAGRLLGSDAAGSGAPSAPDATPHTPGGGGGETPPAPEVEEPPPPPPEPVQPAQPAAAAPASSGGMPRWLPLVLGLLVLLVVLAAAWYFKLIPGLGGDDDAAAPAATATETTDTTADASEEEVVPPTPQTGAEPASPVLKGRALAQSYLSRDPRSAASEMYRQAGEWEQAGDCTAAMIVYQYAAQADPAVAVDYARRFDPDSFSAGGCIQAADADTASYWYEQPAEAGDVAAQRQLGKLLVKSNSSGVLYERGVSWLKRAAEAGDKEAAAMLDKLGENE